MLQIPSSAKVEAQVKKDLARDRKFAQLSEKIREHLKSHFRNQTELSVAPEANMFEMLDGEDLTHLRKSIHENCKCFCPITVDTNGRIVDGRNRLKAMSTLEPQVESVLNASTDPFHYIAVRKNDPTGKEHPHNIEFRVHIVEAKGSSVAETVLLQNIHRRHLTAAQKAAAIAKLTPATDAKTRTKRAAKTRWKGESECNAQNCAMHKSDDDRAKEAGVSRRTITSARRDYELNPKITEAELAGDKKKAKELRDKALGKKPKVIKEKPETTSSAKNLEQAGLDQILTGLNFLAQDQQKLSRIFEHTWWLLETSVRDKLLDQLEMERTKREAA
mgnify:FL=1